MELLTKSGWLSTNDIEVGNYQGHPLSHCLYSLYSLVFPPSCHFLLDLEPSLSPLSLFLSV